MLQLNRRRICAGGIGLGLGLGLAGCSVTPKPVDPKEHGEQLQKDLDAVIASEEPVKGAIGLYEAMARS